MTKDLSEMAMRFIEGYCPYEYRDIIASMIVLERYNFSVDDLLEFLDEYHENDRNVDLVGVTYAMVLDYISFVFEPICDVRQDFYVKENSILTSFDHSPNSTQKLLKALRDAKPSIVLDVLSDRKVRTWLDEVGVEEKEILEILESKGIERKESE